EPSRVVFPAWCRSASTREVLPTPRWPATAMLRILPGSVTATTARPPEMSVWRADPNLLRLETGACRRAREPCLEAEDRLRMELRDPGLGHPEHLADLAEGELLVVIERHHELLALRQACDRVGDRLLHLRPRE